MQIFLLYLSFLFPLLFTFCINISHNDIFMKPLPQRDCGRFFAKKYMSQKTVVFCDILFVFFLCGCSGLYGGGLHARVQAHIYLKIKMDMPKFCTILNIKHP